MDQLSSDSLSHVKHQRQQRILYVTQGILLMVSLVFLYRAVAWDILPRQISLGIAILLVLFGHLSLRAGHRLLSSHLTLSAVLVAALTSVATSGGPTSVTIAWLLILPPLAGLLLDLRATSIWVVSIFIMLLALVLSEAAGVVFPDLTPIEARTRQNYTHVLAQLGTLSAMIIAFVQTFVSYECSLLNQVKKLQVETAQRAHAEQAAVKSSLAKSRFMANMNHELRTPLNSILGYSRRLLKTKSVDPERARTALDAIVRNSEDLLAIVNELLDMSELEEVSDRFRWQHVTTATIVDHVLNQCQHSTMLDGTLKVINCGGVDSDILADPQYLQRALFNVIRFILHLVRQGEITVQVIPSNKAPYCVVIVVSAVDPHSDVAYLQSLFALDEHDVVTGDNESPAVSMGLPMANRIVQLHDGEIRVESNHESGIDFCLYLSEKPLLSGLP